MNKQQEQQEAKYKKSIEKLEKKYEQLINNQQREKEELLEEQRIKYEKILTAVTNQQEQQEIKYKKSIEKLENKIEQLMNSQQTNKDNIETKYSKIIEKLEERLKNIELDKENLSKLNLEQNSKITKLEEKLENFKTIATATNKAQNNCQPFITKFDKSSPGILQTLKNNEKSPFDKLFIPSQSSNDIYNVIDPTTNDYFSIPDFGKYIEIELQKSIAIIGIKIFSSLKNFPKSFDIEINNVKIASIKEAKELNGKNQEMTINVKSIQCNKIRIINRGQNWDNGKTGINIKRIEILSNKSEYSSGVFSILVNQSENHDPHKCPVIISASNFDINTFHSINSLRNICTHDVEKSWFQIEFPYGKAIINGFRLEKSDPSRIKKCKIICTDDASKPLEEWTILIEIDEKSKTEHEILDIYEFPQPSPPIKFIRLIQTGPNWNNNDYLLFYHLDFFGSYI